MDFSFNHRAWWKSCLIGCSIFLKCVILGGWILLNSQYFDSQSLTSLICFWISYQWAERRSQYVNLKTAFKSIFPPKTHSIWLWLKDRTQGFCICKPYVKLWIYFMQLYCTRRKNPPFFCIFFLQNITKYSWCEVATCRTKPDPLFMQLMCIIYVKYIWVIL